MAVTFEELLARAQRKVAQVSPARGEGPPTSTTDLFQTRFRGVPTEVPLRPAEGLDVDAAIERAGEAVGRLDRPLRILGPPGGRGETPPEDRPKPDIAGFLASINRPEAVVEVEDQGFLERSWRSILAGFGRVGSGLVRGVDEIVKAFEAVYLGRHTEPGEYRYLTDLAEQMADPTTYGYTPTPVWENLKAALSEGRLWDAAKTLASGGVELAIASIPDMIFLLAAPLRAPYVASLTTQYAVERMEREKRDYPTWSDVSLGAASAAIVTQLERIGAERALGIVQREGITTFVRRMWDAIRTEGLTEGAQSAVEGLLVKGTSGGGVTPAEFLEDVVAGAVLGGAAGGAMGLPGATVRSVFPAPQQEGLPPPPEAPDELPPDTGAAPEVREAIRREFGRPPPRPPKAAPDQPRGRRRAETPTLTEGPRLVREGERIGETEEVGPIAPPTAGAPPAQAGEPPPAQVEPSAAAPTPQLPVAAPVEDEGFDEQMMRAMPEGLPDQEGRTPTPAQERLREPETRIDRRDLDELAKSEEGRAAVRALVDRLRSQAADESEATVLRLGALRLQSARTRELLAEPLNRVFSRLPLEERVAITNALRSGDAAGLRAALGRGAAPAERTTLPSVPDREAPEVGTAPTPENLLAHYNSIEAVPAGRRFAAKLPDRIGNLLPLAQSVRSLPGLPEQDVATLNQVIAQLTRWMSAPPERVRKGAVTTHKKVDQVSQTIKGILESLEHEFVPTGPSGRFQQLRVRKKPGAEPAALPSPAEKPRARKKTPAKKAEPQKAQEEPKASPAGRMGKEEFDRLLLDAQRAGVLALSRSDLAANAPPDVVRASEIKLPYGGAVHSVRTDRDIPASATPEQRAFAERVLAAARELVAESTTRVDHKTGRVGEKVMLSKVLERMNAKAAAVKPAQPREEPRSREDHTRDKLEDLLGRALKRAAMEEAGQEILDELEEQGRSPREVSDQFWSGTYFRLPGQVQARFQRYLRNLTGMQPGDALGTDANGQLIIAEGWVDIGRWWGEDLPSAPDGAAMLEGTERGYVALMEEANRRVAAMGAEGGPATRPAPAASPRQLTAPEREIIKVKPKPVRGRQAETLLNMLGMQVEPGSGRRALEQLRTVLPTLNTKTGRVFALVPTLDAKGQLKAGAIPIPAAEKLRDVVYAHVRSGNPAVTLQNLKDFLDDIGDGRALDPETQAEVLDFAEQLRSLRERRLAEVAEERPETEEERQLREIREETEQTAPDQDILRGGFDIDELGDVQEVSRNPTPPSITEIITERLSSNYLELGMLGAVADEAGIADAIEEIEQSEELGTLFDFLMRIAEGATRVAVSGDQRYEKAASRLAAVARALAESAPADTPLRFRRDPRIRPFGAYYPGTRPAVTPTLGAVPHGITINYDSKGQESPAALMFAVLHEAAHAATSVLIQAKADTPEVKGLERLFNQVKMAVVIGSGPLTFEHNAFVNLGEFAVEVLSNPQFLRELSFYNDTHQFLFKEQKSIVDKFVESITKLLGLEPKHETLVRLVSDASWSVVAAQRSDPQIQAYLRRAAAAARLGLDSSSKRPTDPEFLGRVEELGGVATAKLARHGALAGRDFTSGLFGAARKAFLALHTMDQIERRHAEAFEGVAGGGNALKDLVNTYRRRRAISTKLQEDAEKSFSRAWLNLGAKESERLGEVMRDSTLWKIDPTLPPLEQSPEAQRDRRFEQKYQEVKAAYDALTPEAKKVYQNARDYFTRMRRETRRALTDLVLDSYAESANVQPSAATRRRIAEVRRLKDLDELIGAGLELDYGEQNAAVRRGLWKVAKMVDLSGPYFPLRRYGEYVVSVKEDVDEVYDTPEAAREAMERIENEAPANDVTVSEDNGKWRVTGARYEFSIHDTRGEAEREKARLAERGIDAYIGMKLDANPLGGNEGAVAAMMEAVNRRLAGDPEAKKLVEMAFIELMADRATHASRLMREGYAGVKGADMRRAVAERAVGSAWNIADMRTVLAESDALKRLRKAAIDQSVDDNMRIRRGLVVNELTRSRAQMLANRGTSAWTRAVTTFGYLRFLADPAYAFVNLTQTPVVALPTIGARYGYGRTFAAMRRAYRAVTSPTIINAIRGYARRPGDVTQYDLLSATMKALEAHPTYKKYVPALQQMIDNDVIDATFTQELISAARGGALGHSRWQRLLEYSKLLPQGTEFLNRFVTAITMLELTNGDVEKAADMVRLTQFDYTAENRPRAFRFPGARAVLMFKMYAQGIGNLLISSFYDSIRRHSGRAEALRTLGGLIATHSMAAGVLGGVMLEPLRWMINAVLWAVTDDEEQTPDIDTLVSNWMADTFGQRAGEIVARGLPMAVGVDLSRMSLGNLLFHDSGQDWISPEGLVSLLGPLPQVAFDAKRGLDDIREGRYERAASRLVPVKVLADFARAIELKTRGITTGAGVTRIPPEEVSAMEVALTGLGFTPRRVRLDVERRRVERQRQEFLSDTRGSLLRRWRQARTAAERQRVAEDVRRFNRANPSNRIRLQDLIRSRREEQRAIRRSLTGRHTDRTLREQLRFLD